MNLLVSSVLIKIFGSFANIHVFNWLVGMVVIASAVCTILARGRLGETYLVGADGERALYFPGHGTRLFYRVTNVSGNTISLDRSKGTAQVAFERVMGRSRIHMRALSSTSSTLTAVKCWLTINVQADEKKNSLC